MDKVVRDGKVAVLYSPGYGAGWYTNHSIVELVFHPVLVTMVEAGKQKKITEELILSLLGKEEDEDFYLGGVYNLSIAWLEEGDLFQIEEYDGSEYIMLQKEVKWITA